MLSNAYRGLAIPGSQRFLEPGLHFLWKLTRAEPLQATQNRERQRQVRAKDPLPNPGWRKHGQNTLPFCFPAFYKTMRPLPPPLPEASIGLRTLGDPARDPDLLGSTARRGQHARTLCNCNAQTPFAQPTACFRYFCSTFPFALSGEANKILLLSWCEVHSFSQ